MLMRFYTEDNKKVYTLKSVVDDIPTLDAHYKFIRIRDVDKSKPFIRRKK